MAKLFISNKTESIRLFKNNFLESISKVHFAVPIFVFVPVISYFIYVSFAERDYTVFELLGCIILGFIAWTLTEYVMHRFVFHYHPTSQFGKKIHFLMHGVHHDYPNDAKRLVLPPSLSIPLTFAFYYFYSYFIGVHYTPAFFAAFLSGYLFYDISHYAIHHFKFDNKIWSAIKEYHMRHHFVDPNAGYGVSSPVWDVIFNSGYEVAKKEEVEEEKIAGLNPIAEVTPS